MNAARWKLILYLTAIFVAGGASGWMVALKSAKEKPFPGHEDVARRLKVCLHSELNLTDEQKRKIDDIVDDTADEVKALMKPHVKRVGEIVSNRNERIMALLNPEQKQIFLLNEEKRQREIREKFHSRGGSRDRDRDGSRRRERDGKRDEKCETNASGEVITK
jgi:Spy/CpxP family protein refolding chaperone